MNASKTILILGAGPDQLPIYQAAKRRGLRIIGADGRFDSVAKPLADRFLHIQAPTGEEVRRSLGNEIIDGVVSPGNDSFHEAIYDLTKAYQLPPVLTPAAVRASSDKGYFCQQVHTVGVCAPFGKSSQNKAELVKAAHTIGLPLIVKPIDSSGNKGVTLVRSAEELVPALDNAFAVSPHNHVIVETYIDGEHGGMEVFRINGETKLMAISQRHHSGPPDFLTLKHVVGLPQPVPLIQKLTCSVNKICDLFGIHNGPLNLDFVVRPNGDVFFLEMGARLSGNGFPHLVKHCYGWDTYDLALKVALGELVGVDLPPPAQQSMAGIMVVKTAVSGILQGYEHLDTIRQHPAFVQEHFFVQPGDTVTRFSQANHRLGYFMVASPNHSEIEEILRIFDEQFTVIIQSKGEKSDGA